jgi:hypothetical protein
MKDEHESYGMISISKFTGRELEYFGSDLVHNSGVTITISSADKETKLSSDWYRSKADLIEIELSNNQFVDAITSGMNTSGVPCTIKRIARKSIPQISHVRDKKEQFSNDMKDVHKEYEDKINNILEMMDGNIGKGKSKEIKSKLGILKNHISRNTNYVMSCFNESMEKAVTEAKHSVSNYIDHKVHSFGIESMRKELEIKIEKELSE